MFASTPPSARIGSLILAAGASSRMGKPKALLPLTDGSPFLAAIVRAHRCLAGPRVVVAGPALQRLRAVIDEPVDWVVNDRPEDGPLSSLLLGLALLVETRGVIVHAVDHPLVRADTLAGLARTHQRLPACILVPEHRGRKGHPVLFPARFYSDLRAAPLEIGARAVVRRNAACVHRVPVQDPGILVNVNTPAAYAEHVLRRPASG